MKRSNKTKRNEGRRMWRVNCSPLVKMTDDLPNSLRPCVWYAFLNKFKDALSDIFILFYEKCNHFSPDKGGATVKCLPVTMILVWPTTFMGHRSVAL